jgi:hypothetical protein
MFLSRAAACRRILVPPGSRASGVAAAVVPRSGRCASSSSPPSADDDDDGPSRPLFDRRRRRGLHVGLASSLFDSRRPPPPSSSSLSSDDDVGGVDRGDGSSSPSPSSDARLVGVMTTALLAGVSKFDCPAPPSSSPLLSSASNASGGGGGGGGCFWDANRNSERRIVIALDRALEIMTTRDSSSGRREGDGGGRRDDDDDDDGVVVTLTSRLGYRSAAVVSSPAIGAAAAAAAAGGGLEDDDDRSEGEGTFEGDSRVGTATTASPDGGAASALVHNLGEEYVLQSLRTSPLVRRYRDGDGGEKSPRGGGDDDGGGAAGRRRVRLISLVHNPETQVASHLSSSSNRPPTASGLDAARDRMRRRLTSAFVGYEIAVGKGWIDGYGVDSNGLCLPTGHDMHVDWRDVLSCAADAYLEASSSSSSAAPGGDVGGGSAADDRDAVVAGGGGRSSLKVVRLPGNLVETRGLDVAGEIRSFMRRGGSPSSVADDDGDGGDGPSSSDDACARRRKERKLRGMRALLPESLDVIVTRPLAAYPHGGTGWNRSDDSPSPDGSGGGGEENADSVHPVRLVDYRIEAGSTGTGPASIWSNEHYVKYGIRPAAYQPILNAALSHFDAYDILEASRDRELTVEERETLDGCKLLRDMLHDMDASLEWTRSFDAYEDHLMNVAVPLIYGTFEELDEESAGILQLFFKAHGMAVRMAVARWTRDLLLAGWKRIPPATKDGDGGCTWEKDTEKERMISRVWKSLGLGNSDGGYAMPGDVTLQEFALKQLFKSDVVSGVVVGCSSPEHVLEAIRAADSSCADLTEEQKV